MEPLVSWGIVLAVVGGGYYYYNRETVTQAIRQRPASTSEAPKAGPSKREARAKRKPAAASASELSANDEPVASARDQPTVASADGLKKRKIGNGKNSAASPSITVRDSDADSDAAANNRFAESMLKAKEGAKLAPPAKHTARAKTVKTSGLSNVSPSFSSASSTAGADADVELSPGPSPSLQASGDVSDMLEPAAPGPSVLRLTEDPNKTSQKQKQKQSPKEFQVAETKKQRQNRQKNEDRKAANAESEASRQKLLEQQRRTAREARGEPAKNGLQQSKAPATSAWTAKPAGVVDQTHATPPVQPLLDTFDSAQAPAIGNAQASVMPNVPAPTNGTSATSGTSGPADYTNGLSEQAQIDIATRLSEDENGWNEVPTKKTRARSPKQDGRQNKTTTSAPAKATNGANAAAVGRFAGLHVDD